MTEHQTHLNDDAIAAFGAEAKVGILATVSAEGLPHISLITSLRARDATHLTFGEFSTGDSKLNVQRTPRCAFVVMGLDRRLWHGQATWTHKSHEGEDHVIYNNQALFRYNAYTGFHTIHYLDLRRVQGPTPLSLPRLIAGSLRARATAAFKGSDHPEQVLKPWAEALVGKLDALKFVAFIDDDGFPELIPVVPCYPASSGRLVLNGGAALAAIGSEKAVALFALSLSMESVLMRGRLTALNGAGRALLDMDWVYNSMLPVIGQIYPMLPLEPMRDFSSDGATGRSS